MFLKWNCLLVLSLIHLQRTQGNVIVGGPEPPYPLNNNNVTLNCSTSLEGNIIWSVNEFLLNNERRLAIWAAQGVTIQNLQPTLSIITIRSGLHLNNTRFRCEVEGPRVIDGIIGVSNFISFTYYDIPSTPTDLMISVNFSQPGLQLSWTPGFALANEPVWYVVTISSPQKFESVVTSPSVFIPSVGRSCPRYSLMIQALNEVGTSNGSLKTVQVAPIGLADFRNVQTRVDLDVDMAFLNIIFTDPSPCLEYRVLEYTLALSEVMNSDGVNVSDPFMPSPVNYKGQGSEITIAVNTSSGLLPDRLYSVDLVARSLVNSVTTTVSIYTTGLQSASISVNSTTINATCFFAEGTISRGCLFLLRDSTVLLNISLKSGDVVAMGTAPYTPSLLIENMVAVEILQNGDPSEIHITPATVVTSPIPTTQPPDVIVGGPEPPYPLNNNNVTLNCTTSLEGNIIWSVNEFQLNTEMRLAIWAAQGVIVQNLQPTLSIITIRSRYFNNTRFRCEVEGPRVLDGIIGFSNFISFTYYDIPSTPTDLMISVNFSQPGLQLSWTPGFALANEPVWYVVTISSPQKFESVVTSPSVFIPSVGRSCPRYSLMIQARNEVGTSNGSLKTVQVAPIGLADFRNVQTRVDLDVDMAFLNIIFTDPSPCLEYRVLEYTLALSEVMNSDGVNVSDPFMPSPVNYKGQGSEITIAVNTSSGLLPDRLYSVNLVARSLVNSVTTTVSIYTTGLQSASISVNSTTINATCFFAEGTISRGCLFLLRDSTVLLNISLKSGDVVAMGTAPYTPSLLIENIVAVEILQNGDPSEIHITPATVVTSPIPTTQPPDVIVGGPEPPYPLNNNNVTLNCSTSLEGNIIWSVNEFQLYTERRLAIWAAQGVTIQNFQPTLSIITIRSGLHLNNTRFRCEVEGPRALDGIIGVSNFFNFTYYDIPSTPTDLMISANFSQPGLQLSWTPGFALANEPVWYVVTISGPQMFESVVTSPSVFIPSVGRSCPRYSLMIQALNEVGTSNGSLKTVQVAPIGLADFRNVQTRVDLDVDMAFLNITFTDPSPCLEYRVLEYTLALSEVMNSDGVSVRDPIMLAPINFKSQGSEVTIAVNTSTGLLPDRLYSVDLVARSLVNSVTTSVSIYTTGLQSASISVNSSAINATCFFAEGTNSRGCQFLLRDSTVLLNISLKSGDVVAMGTAPYTPGLLIGNFVAVEVLENGDPSEIHITPATVVTSPIPTTQPPEMLHTGSPATSSFTDNIGLFQVATGVLSAIVVILIIITIFMVVMFMLVNRGTSKGKKFATNLKDPALKTSPNISYGFVPTSSDSTLTQMYGEVSHITTNDNISKLQDPALETSPNISYGFVPVSSVSALNQGEVSHITGNENISKDP